MPGGSKGGSSAPAQQTVTQRTELPAWVSQAGQDNVTDAKNIASHLAPAYTGNTVAGFNDQQAAAWSQAQQASGASGGSLSAAQSALMAAAGYQPERVAAGTVVGSTIGSRDITPGSIAARDIAAQQIGAQAVTGTNVSGTTIGADKIGPQQQIGSQTVNATNVATPATIADKQQQVKAGQFSAEALAKYQDPYTQQVVDAGLSDLERQRQASITQTGDQAAAAGAFGGSRQAIREAVTNSESARAAGQLSAQLRSNAFNTAAGLLTSDQNRQLQADTANQATNLDATKADATNSLTAGLANQSTALQAAMANQSSFLSADKANQATNLATAQSNQAANLEASKANQTNAMAAALANQATNLDVSKTNAGNALAASQSNQNANLQAAMSNQSSWLTADRSNQATSLAAAQSNQDASLRASLANQANALDVSKTNVGNRLTADLANQSAGVTVNGQRIAAGSALTSLGQTQFNQALQQASVNEGIGDKLQGYDQALLNQDANRYNAARNYEQEQLNIKLAALSATPYGETKTTTGPAQQQGGSSLLGALGGASTGASIASTLGLTGALGGYGGVAGAGLGGLMGLLAISDRTEKTDIRKVGEDPKTGLPLYSYRYKGDPKSYPKVVGPMAQDIEKRFPEMVHKVPGTGKRAVQAGFLGGVMAGA